MESNSQTNSSGVQTELNIPAELRRGFTMLEDERFSRADDVFVRILEQDPSCARAYLGRLMCYFHAAKVADLRNQHYPFSDHPYYQKCLRYAREDLKQELKDYNQFILERNVSNTYLSAQKILEDPNSTEEDLKRASGIFMSVSSYRDAFSKVTLCQEKAEERRKEEIYRRAVTLSRGSDTMMLEKALELFNQISSFKDVEELKKACYSRILTMKEGIREERPGEPAVRIASSYSRLGRKTGEGKSKKEKTRIAWILLAGLLAVTVLLAVLFLALL